MMHVLVQSQKSQDAVSVSDDNFKIDLFKHFSVDSQSNQMSQDRNQARSNHLSSSQISAFNDGSINQIEQSQVASMKGSSQSLSNIGPLPSLHSLQMSSLSEKKNRNMDQIVPVSEQDGIQNFNLHSGLNQHAQRRMSQNLDMRGSGYHH